MGLRGNFTTLPPPPLPLSISHVNRVGQGGECQDAGMSQIMPAMSFCGSGDRNRRCVY